MKLGAHISIARGLDKALHMTEEIGGDTFQFFTRNPRGGSARSIGEEEIRTFKELRREMGIGPLVGHLPYTVNMAAEKDEVYRFAGEIVEKDLKRAEALGVEYVVCHPGRNSSVLEGMKRITLLLSEKLQAFPGGTAFLLEAMGAHGSEIGSLKDLGLIISALGHPPGLGVCLDSCHLFAAGWDFRDPPSLEQLKAAVDEAFGLERVKAFHLNDSLFPLGSGKDRHARIGRGHIGLKGFRLIVNDPYFSTLPLILETPVDGYIQYGEEIKELQKLVEG